MREIITTGKTVEEATQKALEELGLSLEEAVVEVIEMPQRKLFRSTPAKVRVSADEPEAPAPAEEKPAAPKAQEKKEPKPAPEKKPQEKPAPAPAEKPAKTEPAKEEPAPEQTPAGEAADEASDEALCAPEEPIDLADYPRVGAAVEYLRDVCAKMGSEGLEITGAKQGETIILKVSGDRTGTLIGHRGEVMESLSYLCSLVVNRTPGDYVKLGLDINNYRAKREANLTALAKRIAEKVARTGRSHTLEPMNPYERRIIHSAVSGVEGVKSESTGEGAARRVVILPVDMDLSEAVRRREGRRDGGRRDRRPGRGEGRRSGRSERSGRREGGRRERSSVPGRAYADRPRDPSAAPVAPRRTETINDGADLPLFGKIEL